MKQVVVRLAPLSAGVVLVSDVVDPLGRLLVKAPVTLDEHLKALLIARGVTEVFIEDRRSADRVESEVAIQKEMQSLEKRLPLFRGEDPERALREAILRTVESFYLEKR